MRFHDRRVPFDIMRRPTLGMPEAYMDGRIDFDGDDILGFLDLFRSNSPWESGKDDGLGIGEHPLLMKLGRANNAIRARRNVAHHYDLSDRLYDLFLDRDRQYSCAYFTEANPDRDLDRAQLEKKAHIAAKLHLKPGQRVLDIGCGWGGLGLYLAEFTGADVTGITLSKEQHAAANERATEKGLAKQARFNLTDYRDVARQFDRIVSVGMFEHVGVNHYDRFFRKSAQLLDRDGVMVLHSIGRSDGPSRTSPWIAKYIFPGGYIPSLSEVLPAIEKAGLLVTDIEILRLHYAETLKAWRERFLAHLEEVERIYDKRFVRMWEFYLAASEMSFREQNLMVFQIQLTKRQGIVPITRDYIVREEQRLRTIETKRFEPLRLAGE
jgi:cyclopropane-fatty-acyl-phospholipid synthase